MILATWNVQGIRTKWQEIINEIKRMKIDLIALTETKKKSSGVEEIGEYLHFYSGVPKEERAKRGVSLLIRKKFKKNITNFEAVDERIIKVNINYFGRRLTIFGVYAPNDDEIQEVKDKFFERMQELIDEIGETREILLLGDFNGRTGCKVNDKVIGSFGENITNNNGERLIEFCKANDLRITNGFFKHKEIHKYTWIQHTKKLKSIIDYVIVKQRTHLKILDIRVQRGVDCGSDHYMVRAKVTFPYIGTVMKQDTGEMSLDDIQTPNYVLENLTEESIRQLFQTRLDNKLKEREFPNVSELYDHIKLALHQAAFEALGQRKEKKNQKRNFWWDDEIEQVVQQKKDAYLNWMNTKKDEDREKYKTLREKTKKIVLERKRMYWDRKCREIETYLGGRRCTEAWRFLRNVRQESDAKAWQGITVRQWEEYYKNLLTENRMEFQNEDTNLNHESDPVTLNIEVIKQAIKKLKNLRASGPGGIPAELIKNGTEKLCRMITQLLEKCINGHEIPEEWKIGFLTSIFKKGDRQKCENYRGITVTSTFSRLYGRILRDLIEEEFQPMEAEEQCGFRAGRSCMDNIFCIKQMIEKRIAVGQETHLLFIDLAKAYDNVPITKLWRALKEARINDTVIKAVQELYRQSTTKIKMGRGVSRGFLVTKGLRQGCCISPTLFKIYIEQALKDWKRKCQDMGINLNRRSIFTLQFADDQVLIAEDKDDLEYMTRKIKEEYEKWGLSMNVNKTKYLCVGGIATNLQLENGDEISICDHYNYLGIEIAQDGRDRIEINKRIAQGRKAVKRLNGIWWNEEISKKRKWNIYNAIVKSILLYGAEAWRLAEAEKKKIAAVEMDALRRSCGISRRERIRNEIIKERMKVKETILRDVQRKQLVWYGHVNRMDNRRLPRITMEFTSKRRKKRGRPRRTWEDGIKKAMEEFGLEKEWCTDREKWKKILEIGRRRQTP